MTLGTPQAFNMFQVLALLCVLQCAHGYAQLQRDSYQPPPSFGPPRPKPVYGPPPPGQGPPNAIYAPPPPEPPPPPSGLFGGSSKPAYFGPPRPKPANFGGPRPWPTFGGPPPGKRPFPGPPPNFGPPPRGPKMKPGYGPPRPGQRLPPGIGAPPTPPDIRYDGWQPLPGVSIPPSDDYGPPPPLPQQGGAFPPEPEYQQPAPPSGGGSVGLFAPPPPPSGNYAPPLPDVLQPPSGSYAAPPQGETTVLFSSPGGGPTAQGDIIVAPQISGGDYNVAGGGGGASLTTSVSVAQSTGFELRPGRIMPKEPVQFRAPVPQGLITSIGEAVVNNGGEKGPTYLPPPVPDPLPGDGYPPVVIGSPVAAPFPDSETSPGYSSVILQAPSLYQHHSVGDSLQSHSFPAQALALQSLQPPSDSYGVPSGGHNCASSSFIPSNGFGRTLGHGSAGFGSYSSAPTDSYGPPPTDSYVAPSQSHVTASTHNSVSSSHSSSHASSPPPGSHRPFKDSYHGPPPPPPNNVRFPPPTKNYAMPPQSLFGPPPPRPPKNYGTPFKTQAGISQSHAASFHSQNVLSQQSYRVPSQELVVPPLQQYFPPTGPTAQTAPQSTLHTLSLSSHSQGAGQGGGGDGGGGGGNVVQQSFELSSAGASAAQNYGDGTSDLDALIQSVISSQGHNADVQQSQSVATSYQSNTLSSQGGSNDFSIRGQHGRYTLQIQGSPGSSEHVPHSQVLSDGLLQDILAAIEQQQPSGDIEGQSSGTSSVLVSAPVDTTTTTTTTPASPRDHPDLPFSIKDQGIALYFRGERPDVDPRTPGNSTADGIEQERQNQIANSSDGSQRRTDAGSHVSFNDRHTSYQYNGVVRENAVSRPAPLDRSKK